MRGWALVLLLAILTVPWTALPDEEGGGVGTSIAEPPSSVQGEATSTPDRALALEGNFFVENVGQLDDPEVRYFAQDGELSVGLRREGVVFTLRKASHETLY